MSLPGVFRVEHTAFATTTEQRFQRRDELRSVLRCAGSRSNCIARSQNNDQVSFQKLRAVIFTNTFRGRDVPSGSIQSAIAPVANSGPKIFYVCPSIMKYMDHQSCLHLSLEGGIFQDLRPQPKAYGVNQTSEAVSLSVLFKLQEGLGGHAAILTSMGKRVLAVTLATALLPFLETPWIQPSFNHSNILLFKPLQDGQFPDITKPFLSTERTPIISAGMTDAGVSSNSSEQRCSPNASSSIVALGRLLYELQYFTPMELKKEKLHQVKNNNIHWDSTKVMLDRLEADTSQNYCHAVKACLHWKSHSASVDVKRKFYKNIIKLLEDEIQEQWALHLKDLGSLHPRHNELCWGSIDQEVIFPQSGNVNLPVTNIGARALPYRSISDAAPASYTALKSDTVTWITGPPQLSSGPQLHGHPVEGNLYFFDASREKGSGQE